MPEVIEINDPGELAPFRMTWNLLLGATPDASFFHTFEWFDAWWRHHGRGSAVVGADRTRPAPRLRVLVVFAAGRPVGIVPLVLRHEPSRFGPLRVLTYPLDDGGAWFSPIGGLPAATLRLAMRHIAATPRDWDLIDLPRVDAEGTDRGRTGGAMQAAGLRATIQRGDAVSRVAMQGDWESYLAGLRPDTRRKCRRILRRVEELGEVEYLRHRPLPSREGDGDPRWDLYDQCEAIAARSRQAESITGATPGSECSLPLLREAHLAASRLGMVDVNLLKIDGVPVAYHYNYHHDRTVLSQRAGCDGGGPLRGVGLALLLLSMKDSFRRGDRQHVLGCGDQAYKRRLRTSGGHTYRISCTPLTSWRSQLAQLRRWSGGRDSPGAAVAAG